MKILSDIYRCKSYMILSSADILCLCIPQQSYLRRGYYQKVKYRESQTSKYEHSEQCTILVDFQGKQLQSIQASSITKTIQELKKIGNYSKYTQVLGNQVWSSMEIMRSYVISNGVIKYKKKPGRSTLKENNQVGRKILSSTNILSRLNVREMLSMMSLNTFR